MMHLLDGVEGREGCWLASIPPHQVAKLAKPLMARGTTSVLLVSTPHFDGDRHQLRFGADDVAVLNLGTTARTFVVDAVSSDDAASKQQATDQEAGQLGPGDREFVHLTETELRGEAKEAAIDLIREVRRRWPGDLKRGERNNFSNTPDNFWYVIVQPRVQALSITIRGVPSRFQSNLLDLRVDRPGYTRFTIKSSDEIPEALRLIEQSKRKVTHKLI
jgi:hypothetical protein